MQAFARARRRTWEVLEVARPGDELSRVIDCMIMGLVVLNVAAVVLESVHGIRERYHELFHGFELVSVVAFSAEFVLRIWAAAERAGPGGHALRARIGYLLSPLALADLAAIAPFYLSAFFRVDLRFLRMLRLLRLLKLTRYSNAMARMKEVLALQKNALGAAFLVLAMVVVFSASTIYVVESEVQPETFGSIPDAMWWAVVTLTTVGYGDATPITPLGKLMASAISIVGIGMVALPTSLLASGFSYVMSRNQQTLREEIGQALEDGVVSQAEVEQYDELARSLHVEETMADEIFRAALEHHRESRLLDDCPHCGKPLPP
jgi:voltage-gated potassium channel